MTPVGVSSEAGKLLNTVAPSSEARSPVDSMMGFMVFSGPVLPMDGVVSLVFFDSFLGISESIMPVRSLFDDSLSISSFRFPILISLQRRELTCLCSVFSKALNSQIVLGRLQKVVYV